MSRKWTCKHAVTVSQRKDVRSLAYQLTKKAKNKNNKNKTTKILCVGVRTPEATSTACATAFKKTNVEKFFELHEEGLERFSYRSLRIFNIDATGVTTV